MGNSASYATPAQVQSEVTGLQSRVSQMISSEEKSTIDQLKKYVTAEIQVAQPTLTQVQVDSLANNLLKNNAFLNNVSNGVASSGNLSSAVAAALVKDSNFNSSLQVSLLGTPQLANSVAQVLAETPTYAQKLQGPPGTIGAGDITFGGKLTAPGVMTANGGVNIPSSQVLHFGSELAIGSAANQKEANAGKIGYNTFGGTADRPHLAIVGGGKAGQSRRVRMWDEVNATGNVSIGTDGAEGKFYLNPGSDAWLRLQDKSGQYGGYGFAASNLWAEKDVTVNNKLNLGRWSIYPVNDQLCFSFAGADTMCLGGTGDLLNVYRNRNHAPPYLYYNTEGTTGVLGIWDGSTAKRFG